MSPLRRAPRATGCAGDQDVAGDGLVDSVPEGAVRGGVQDLKARAGEGGGGVLAPGYLGVP
jgi:hypothetical protein